MRQTYGAHAVLLQCVAVCCSVLQCVAVCCSVLQCVAVCCSALQFYLSGKRLDLVLSRRAHSYVGYESDLYASKENYIHTPK